MTERAAETTMRAVTAFAALALVATVLIAVIVTLRTEQSLERHLEDHRCDNRTQHEQLSHALGVDPPPRPASMPDCPNTNGTTP